MISNGKNVDFVFFGALTLSADNVERGAFQFPEAHAGLADIEFLLARRGPRRFAAFLVADAAAAAPIS